MGTSILRTHSIPAALITVSMAMGQDFGPPQVITSNADYATGLYAADLDADGDMDALSASWLDDKIAWYENLGNGQFGPEQIISTQADFALAVHAADLDGDGDADVLSASRDDNKTAWYENLGGGAFGPQQVISTANEGARSLHATDLDGDGDPDVIVASEIDDEVAWYENLGGGSFGPQQIITLEADGPQTIYAADLDGDGDADVLSASRYDDKICWYKNVGAGNGLNGGSFGSPKIISTNANFAWSVYAIDLDGDLDLDVLSASQKDYKIAWYENNGNGKFGPEAVITKDAKGANCVHAADLDGDGDADVLSASDIDNDIAWYENVGAGNGVGGGAFTSKKIIFGSAYAAKTVFAIDLDGDSDPDVLSASSSDDKISWYENLMGGPSQCNVVFCDTDAANLGDVALSTCDCSGGSITLHLSTTFTGQFTYPLVGLGTTAVSPTGVSELCLAGSTIGRYTNDAGAISATGTFSIDLLNAASAPGGGVPTIGGALCNGNTWRFQYWHRAGMNPSRFSKGIAGLIY